jgi:hypothetical protein
VQITGAFTQPVTSTTTSSPTAKQTSSFQDCLAAAQQGTSNSAAAPAATPGKTNTGNSAVQDFLSYMHESPGERMFDSWLGSQHMSRQQFESLGPAEKQKVMERFRRELEEKMKSKLDGTADTTGAVS